MGGGGGGGGEKLSVQALLCPVEEQDGCVGANS